MAQTVTLSRAQRVELARQSPLPRKPIPCLLLLCRLYRDGRRGDGSIVFDDPAVDSVRAIANLVTLLDTGEPSDFGAIVESWRLRWKARWVGGAE